MKKLEPKLAAELRPGTLVASYVHKFEDLVPVAQSGEIRIYSISIKGAKKESESPC